MNKHWADCAMNHGGTECDMGVDCGQPFPRLSMMPGDYIVAADEWPATERAIIEVSRVIYFRDFLRSLWSRLRYRRKS